MLTNTKGTTLPAGGASQTEKKKRKKGAKKNIVSENQAKSEEKLRQRKTADEMLGSVIDFEV
jgi:hypothetical protein